MATTPLLDLRVIMEKNKCTTTTMTRERRVEVRIDDVSVGLRTWSTMKGWGGRVPKVSFVSFCFFDTLWHLLDGESESVFWGFVYVYMFVCTEYV